MPSARFLRRAQFFRIPQEIFRIPQEVFRCRQTHPALACPHQGAEDNDAAVPCVGYGLRHLKRTFRTCRQNTIATAPRNAVAMQSGPRTWTALARSCFALAREEGILPLSKSVLPNREVRDAPRSMPVPKWEPRP